MPGLPDLLQNLSQVVRLRTLQRRKLDIRLEFLQPQELADGQQVPVVNISRNRTSKRAGDAKHGALRLPGCHFERIPLDVVHKAPVIRHGPNQSVGGIGRRHHGVIEFPVFVAHRRRLGSRIVEEGVARRLVALTLQVVALVNAIQRCLDDARVLAGLDLLLEPVASRARQRCQRT